MSDNNESRTQPDTVDGDPIGDLQAESRQEKLDDFIASMKTQPEATAPAQDLSAATLAQLREQYWEFKEGRDYGTTDPFVIALCDKAAWEAWKGHASLTSSANALSAGDRVDAGPTDAELLNFVAAHPEMTLRHHKRRWSFVGFTNYEYDAFKTPREAIAAAILQSQKGGNNG